MFIYSYLLQYIFSNIICMAFPLCPILPISSLSTIWVLLFPCRIHLVKSLNVLNSVAPTILLHLLPNSYVWLHYFTYHLFTYWNTITWITLEVNSKAISLSDRGHQGEVHFSVEWRFSVQYIQSVRSLYVSTSDFIPEATPSHKSYTY